MFNSRTSIKRGWSDMKVNTYIFFNFRQWTALLIYGHMFPPLNKTFDFANFYLAIPTLFFWTVFTSCCFDSEFWLYLSELSLDPAILTKFRVYVSQFWEKDSELHVYIMQFWKKKSELWNVNSKLQEKSQNLQLWVILNKKSQNSKFISCTSEKKSELWVYII